MRRLGVPAGIYDIVLWVFGAYWRGESQDSFEGQVDAAGLDLKGWRFEILDDGAGEERATGEDHGELDDYPGRDS